VADRTPAAWLELLEHRLHERWNRWKVYDDYYEGDHHLSAWLAMVQSAFRGTTLGKLLAELQDNYMPLVVDSSAERLRVQGFRFGKETEADEDAWEMWQANGADAQANMLHTESIKLGEGSWLVEPRGEGKIPLITCEHPSQVIVATAPGNRRNRLAALKKWIDDDQYVYANLYLPDHVYKVKSQQKISHYGGVSGGRINWQSIDTVSNSLGAVPAVPLPNNPSMLRGGKSDLAGGPISLQDMIEKTVVDLLIGAEYHGLPQRAMLGVEPPRDPATGQVISDAKMQKQKLWYFNSKDAKAHEFSQADLKGLRESIDGFIGDLAAQTRIPIYYFRPAAISNISAEALIGLDAGLVSKTDDKKDPFGEGHEEMIRLAFKAKGDEEKAKAVTAETIWADTESRSQAQVVDAASKKKDIGVPFEQLMEDIGYSPQQIDRMVQQRETDALLAAATLTEERNATESETDGRPFNVKQRDDYRVSQASI
jgi:Phage portal protein, SPP1 Gp6-like